MSAILWDILYSLVCQLLMFLCCFVLVQIVRRHGSLFVDVARLPKYTLAHQTLWCHIYLSLSHLSDPS